MARILLAVFIICCTQVSSSAQVVKEKAKEYALTQQIDTFLIYSYPCSGCNMSLDSCAVDITYYLTWKQRGSYYCKKFKYCHDFETIPLGESNPLQFYLSYKRTINAEKIQLPTCYEYVRKGNKVDTFLRITTIEHSCTHNFSIHINGKSVVKQADVYQLDFARFDDGRKNIYYNYNQRTKLKALVDMTTSLLKRLEQEKSSFTHHDSGIPDLCQN